MSQLRQLVWRKAADGTDSAYVGGPYTKTDCLTIAKFYNSEDDSPPAPTGQKHTQLYPTTISNHESRDPRYGAAPELKKGVAAFKRVQESTTPLWVTTYPFTPVNTTSLFGPQEDLLFHVHVPSAAPADIATDWFSSISSALSMFGAGLNANGPGAVRASQPLPPWRTPLTRYHFAAAPEDNDTGFADTDNANANRFWNDGPIMRKDRDVLYLDKTFWRDYFERLDRNIDILVPGVYPDDLAQIKKVAIDIAVLRNKDEFATVAKVLGRNLPHLKTVWAVVTRASPRPSGAYPQQISHLTESLHEIEDDAQVQLGVHNDDRYVPARGVVTANLDRFNIVSTSASVTQVKFVLLTYFEDALSTLMGDDTQCDITGVMDAIERPKPPPPSQKNSPTKDSGPLIPAAPPQFNVDVFARGASTRIPRAVMLDNAQAYNAIQFTSLETNQQPALSLFTEDNNFTGVTILPNIGNSWEDSAWLAVQESWTAALPRLARTMGKDKKALTGWMTVANLELYARGLRAELAQAQYNEDFGAAGGQTIEFIAAVVWRLAWDKVAFNVRIGYHGPLQSRYWTGKLSSALSYVTLGVPVEKTDDALKSDKVANLWLYYNSDPSAQGESYGGTRANPPAGSWNFWPFA